MAHEWFCRDPLLERSDFENMCHIIKYKVTGTRIITDFICTMLGETGSGKSSANFSMALQLDPTFAEDMDNRIAFSIQEYKEIVHRLAESGKSRGKVCLFEEVGVNASSKRWASEEVLELIALLQTVRSTGIIALMSVPDDELFVKDGRRLNKARFATERISEDGYVLIRPYILKQMPLIHKESPLLMEVEHDRGWLALDIVKVPFAPPELWSRFNAKVEKFKRDTRIALIEKGKQRQVDQGPRRRAYCIHEGCAFNINGWLPRSQTEIPTACRAGHRALWEDQREKKL